MGGINRFLPFAQIYKAVCVRVHGFEIALASTHGCVLRRCDRRGLENYLVVGYKFTQLEIALVGIRVLIIQMEIALASTPGRVLRRCDRRGLSNLASTPGGL